MTNANNANVQLPAAACQSCGGWHNRGGMSHKAEGCVCTPVKSVKKRIPIAKLARKGLAAACNRCGGWTKVGGMSHKANGPEGCGCLAKSGTSPDPTNPRI
jgi:hypothetical protein